MEFYRQIVANCLVYLMVIIDVRSQQVNTHTPQSFQRTNTDVKKNIWGKNTAKKSFDLNNRKLEWIIH